MGKPSLFDIYQFDLEVKTIELQESLLKKYSELNERLHSETVSTDENSI